MHERACRSRRMVDGCISRGEFVRLGGDRQDRRGRRRHSWSQWRAAPDNVNTPRFQSVTAADTDFTKESAKSGISLGERRCSAKDRAKVEGLRDK